MPRARTSGAIVASLLLAACAVAPTPRYERAKVAVIELGGDRVVKDEAPVALAEAREALEAASAAKDPEEIEHRAELALKRVAIARAEARRRLAERRAGEAAEDLERLQLQLHERMARETLRKAREAEARAERLRTEAEAEWRRIRAARSEQTRLEELQQQFAELKPQRTERGLVLTLGEVLFDFDSARLKPYALRIMDRLAAFLTRHEGYALTVEGHTDSTGGADYNLRLSRERAQSVADALIERAVTPERVATRGYGESRPVASNETNAGRRQNRRVEIVLDEG